MTRHVQDELHPLGLGLKIWDAYRPAWAQEMLWNAAPNSEFLASPARGGSYHTWGASVDVTLVDLQGREQKMATDFDDLTEAAKSAYVGTDGGVAARMNNPAYRDVECRLQRHPRRVVALHCPGWRALRAGGHAARGRRDQIIARGRRQNVKNPAPIDPSLP